MSKVLGDCPTVDRLRIIAGNKANAEEQEKFHIWGGDGQHKPCDDCCQNIEFYNGFLRGRVVDSMYSPFEES